MVHELTMSDDIDMTDTEVSTDEEGDGVENIMHNPNTKWNLMKPIEREMYESLEQLKFALKNYAVANGYPLRFTRSDPKKLRVRCGKSQNGKTCPFYLRATRIGIEGSFQIKEIVGKHICIRTHDFGSIMTADWIAKHYMNEFTVRPKMQSKELKAVIEKEFPCCNFSIGRYFRAKKLMEEKLSEVTRPSVKRKRRVIEKDDKNCLEKVHNIGYCQNEENVSPPKKKKKVGRPRKTDQVGRFGTMEEENDKLHVEEQPTKETMEVPMSMNTVVTEVEDDDEEADETHVTVDDLRKSGYTKNEIDKVLANKAQDDHDEHGIEGSSLHGNTPTEAQDDDDDDEWIEKTQPPIAIKGRRLSERIVKYKLGKKIEGRGSAMDRPINIE